MQPVLSLTDLLSKDSNNADPARVINISSTNSVDPVTESPLSDAGSGTWSCAYLSEYLLHAVDESLLDQPSKAAGKEDDYIFPGSC